MVQLFAEVVTGRWRSITLSVGLAQSDVGSTTVKAGIVGVWRRTGGRELSLHTWVATYPTVRLTGRLAHRLVAHLM